MSNPSVPSRLGEESSASTGLLNWIRTSNSPLVQALRVSAAAFQLFLVSAGVIGCDVKDGADNGAETGDDGGEGSQDGGEGEGEGSPIPQRVVKPGMIQPAHVQYDRGTGKSNVLGDCELPEYAWTIFPDGSEGFVPVAAGQGAEEEISADGQDNDCDGFTDEPEDCTQTENAGVDADSSNGNVGYCDDDGKWNVVETPATVRPTDEICDGADNDLDGETDNLACPLEPDPRAVKECDNPGEITVVLGSLPATEENKSAVPATSANLCVMKDDGSTSLVEVREPKPIPGYTPAKEGACTPGAENTYGSNVGACVLNKQFCVGQNGEGEWTKGFDGKDPIAEPRGDGEEQTDLDCDDGTTIAGVKAKVTQL